MSDVVLDRVAHTPEAVRPVLTDAFHCAQMLAKDGRRVHVVVKEYEDDRSLQQNRFYWGPCLGDISEQAAINGQRWSKEAWHELFKRMFLGYDVKKVSVAGAKRKRVIRQLRSTSTLKVRPMSIYLEKVQAFAATDLGVHFTVAKWQEYR